MRNMTTFFDGGHNSAENTPGNFPTAPIREWENHTVDLEPEAQEILTHSILHWAIKDKEDVSDVLEIMGLV